MLNPNYVTGYTEASASFTYNKSNGRYNVYFALKFNWKDQILAESLLDYFSVGKLYPVYNTEGQLRSFYYRVNKIDELALVINHYDSYPLIGDKRERYLKWREMYLVKRGIINDVDISSLAEELSSMNPKR